MMTKQGQLKILRFALPLFMLSPVLAEPPSTKLHATVAADGAVLLEGKRYRTVESLKLKIAEINGRKPVPHIHVGATAAMPFPTISNALRMLEEAGAKLPTGSIVPAEEHRLP